MRPVTEPGRRRDRLRPRRRDRSRALHPAGRRTPSRRRPPLGTPHQQHRPHQRRHRRLSGSGPPPVNPLSIDIVTRRPYHPRPAPVAHLRSLGGDAGGASHYIPAYLGISRYISDPFFCSRAPRRRRARTADRRAPLTWATVPADYDIRIRAVRHGLGLSQASFAALVGAARKGRRLSVGSAEALSLPCVLAPDRGRGPHRTTRGSGEARSPSASHRGYGNRSRNCLVRALLRERSSHS